MPQRPRAKVLDSGAAVAAAALYFLAVERFYPFRRFFELDPDEGITAVLASLVARGHPLYRETWSDHAPLFPHLLAAWFDLVGWNVDRGRVLVLIFSSLIVWALYDLMRLVSGHAAALAAVLLLASSAYFVSLGVSLMIGVPSIACAFLSAWALARGQRSRRHGWVVASGALMAVSLAIKLITGFLVPAFALWLAAMEWPRGPRRALVRAALWVGCSTVPVAVLLLALAGPEHLDQLRAVASASAALSRYGFLGLAPIALADWPLVALAVAGTVLMARRGMWELSLFPLWAAAATAALIGYAPVWFHHYLLLSVAAGPCAGVACAEMLGAERRRHALRIAIVITAASLALALPAKLRPHAQTATVEQAEPILAAMRRLARPGEFIVTDAPMFAFRGDLTIAPEIAVLTMKRIATGDLSAKDVIAAIDRRNPRLVLLAHRFPPPLTDAVVEAIRGRYELALTGPPELPVSLYRRLDTAGANRS